MLKLLVQVAKVLPLLAKVMMTTTMKVSFPTIPPMTISEVFSRTNTATHQV